MSGRRAFTSSLVTLIAVHCTCMRTFFFFWDAHMCNAPHATNFNSFTAMSRYQRLVSDEMPTHMAQFAIHMLLCIQSTHLIFHAIKRTYSAEHALGDCFLCSLECGRSFTNQPENNLPCRCGACNMLD